MPTITLTIEIPEGSQVRVAGLTGPSEALGAEDVHKYWTDYLSDNARKIYAAAARIQDFTGENFTLEDIAQNLGIDYESAKSMKITAGRCARKWREDTGTPPPIDFEWKTYGYDAEKVGRRTAYRLRDAVKDEILTLF